MPAVATAVEAASAVKAVVTTVGVTTRWSVLESVAAIKVTASMVFESAVMIEPVPVIEARASVEARPAVEPWAGADKDATGEVFRTVVAVRRTRVWVVAIVAVGAYGGWTDIGRPADSNAHSYAAYSYADCHTLRVRVGRENRQGAN
jgi:hypothetical protein